MIELGQVKAGIVVGSESSGHISDITIDEILNDPDMSRATLKRSLASLTLGSGAVAAVLTHSSLTKSGHKFLGGIVRTASQHNELCRIENDTYFFDPHAHPSMSTDSEGILKNGLLLASDAWEALEKELRWHNSDVDKIFCHQVTSVHQQLLFETLRLDKSKGFSSVEYLGNVGPVSLPITLAIAIDDGYLNVGDKVTMLGIGSGLSSVMLGVKW